MATPYKIEISDDRLATIARKVAAYDWSELPDAGGWRSGVGVADLQRLVTYWQDVYDWRAVERRLNRLPNFMTDIDGEHLHFVHLKGDGSKPPLLLLHGWPGSYLEFEPLLEPLVADGHDVVVPSLPGFAFSKPITGLVGPRRAAALMNGLMGELYGAERFIVQGGDWGNAIAAWMAHDRPDALLGIHLNMVNLHAEDAAPTSDAEKAFVAKRDELLELESGYSHQQGTRPQTLGAAMADSPVGAAGWMLEKIGKWPISRWRPMAARTSGASSAKKSCSPTSCSTSRRPRSSPRPGSIRAGASKSRTSFPLERASRCRLASPPSPTPYSSRRRAPLHRRPTTSCTGATCRRAATSPLGRSRT
ncbi:alpha/beta fold hydrolase [Bradyrhizobium sp. BRP22]|uniref:epoxide hydrolase family protein n=1 Tax=Bradyrhizobium sp. BRP22 TaxID=2793821 RepID=UPI001CD4CCDD|nr:epoxide hydrolase [Bradyrhizobium sp. BRP22]MCA1455893.1 alpha/beta fold hydrolase [Bradyrhizobium sp. BRP22]